MCDNASPNDVMVDCLELILPNLDGSRALTRCFAHVINLVAKSLLKLFDVKKKPKKKAGEEDGEEGDDRDEDDEDELDVDTILAQLKGLKAGTPERDDPNNIYDAFTGMSSEDKAKFHADTKAVKSALTKVSAHFSTHSHAAIRYLGTDAFI